MMWHFCIGCLGNRLLEEEGEAEDEVLEQEEEQSRKDRGIKKKRRRRRMRRSECRKEKSSINFAGIGRKISKGTFFE